MPNSLIVQESLKTLHLAFDALDLSCSARQQLDAAVHSLVKQFDQVAAPLHDLASSPRSKASDAALLQRLESLAQVLKIPQRPVEFAFIPGEGMRLPPEFELPRINQPCIGLVQPDFPGPIFRRALELSAPNFNQDQLWRYFHVTLGLQAGLAELYDLVVLGERVLGQDSKALDEMRKAAGAFEAQPASYSPREPFGGLPWPEDWGRGALPCIKPEIEENIPEMLRRFCPPWITRTSATNFTTPSRENQACEGDLMDIEANFGSSPWVEVLFPFRPIDASFLPRSPGGAALHPTLATLSNEVLVPSDRHRYLVTRIDRSVEIDGVPALTNSTLRVQVPPSLRRNIPGPDTAGVLHGDHIPVVLRRPCSGSESSSRDPQLVNVSIDFIPAPHVVSITGDVVGCRSHATLQWSTQGMRTLELRIVGGEGWVSASPAAAGARSFDVEGLFATGPLELTWEARGEGECADLPLQIGTVPVRYDVTVSLSRSSIAVEEHTTLTVRRPSCVTDPRHPLTITLWSEGRGILGHPAEITIPAGVGSTSFDVTAQETGQVRIILSGTHVIEQRVSLDVNHDVRPIPAEALEARCLDLIGMFPEDFVNWHRNIVRPDVLHARPNEVRRLVDAVMTADGMDWKIGTRGSGWSYTNCAVGADTELVIRTDDLRGILTDDWRGGVLRRNPDVPAAQLVHVGAGTKIFQLNCLLEDAGLMLPTMGGSHGQSIAGVIGTSVHGAHFDRPPIPDAVRAIHLVGPGGREWWIEPETDSITNPTRMADARDRGDLCPSTIIVYDDALFNAALVSLGAAGVMFSLVLAAEPIRNVATRTENVTWAQAQFDIAEWIIAGRPPRLGPNQVDFLEIVLDPATRTGRKTLRAYTTESLPLPPPAAGGSTDWATTALLRALQIDPASVIGVASATVVLATSTVFSSLMLAVSEWIARKSFEAWFNPGVIGELTQVTADLNELMFDVAFRPFSLDGLAAAAPNLINLIWRLGMSVASGAALVAELQGFLIEELRPLTNHPTGYTVGRNYTVLSGQPPRSPGSDPECTASEHSAFERLIASYEYALPAENLAAFMDELFAIYDELRAGKEAFVATYNLRFTGPTRATLGIQRFAHSAHVEIFTVHDLRGNGRFRQRLFGAVRRHGAIPHPGQLHEVGSSTATVYGSALTDWQTQIRRIADESGGRRDLFWTRFHADAGLLP